MYVSEGHKTMQVHIKFKVNANYLSLLLSTLFLLICSLSLNLQLDDLTRRAGQLV